jgi:hypothetical protein
MVMLFAPSQRTSHLTKGGTWSAVRPCRLVGVCSWGSEKREDDREVSSLTVRGV